jgi:digeranylgeranylglycerophospholipid reductase
MKTIYCDVLVVGAGPAGLSVANSAAEKGLIVYCIDKKKEIGVPVKCAEGVGKYLLEYLPFKIPKKFFDLEIDGMIFNSNGISIKKRGGYWKGFSINREKLEKWLAELAQAKGMNLILDIFLDKIYFDSKKVVKKVSCFNSKEKIDFIPKIVIAADGVHSQVLTSLGVYKKLKGNYAKVYSWEMKNLKLCNYKYEHVFFDNFTPKGYAYIFPKGRSIANVGIGGVDPKKNVKSYFSDFISNDLIKNQFFESEYLFEKSKDSPFYHVLKNRQIGNVIAVGDAANDNLKPFVEGILPAIIIGDAIGKSLFEKKFENPLRDFFDQSDKLLEVIKYLYSLKDYSKASLLLCYLVAEVITIDEVVELYKKPITKLIELI